MSEHDQTTRDESSAVDTFSQQANMRPPGFVREFWDFLRYNKAWWLTPIMIILVALGALIFLAPAGLAPFFYPLF